MDGASGWRSRKDSSLRKTSRERLCAAFSKRGASGRHNKLVRKIPDAVFIPKEVRGIGHETIRVKFLLIMMAKGPNRTLEKKRTESGLRERRFEFKFFTIIVARDQPGSRRKIAD